jgi:hypothetical protein
MRQPLLAFAFALIPSLVLAQAPATASKPAAGVQGVTAVETGLATPAGHELTVSLGHYVYAEPSDTSISIHGAKFAGDYTGTVSFGARQHWFAQGNVRGVAGSATYDGWCSPWLIRPNSASPNGYELGLGDPSPCSESGDSDWYVEARGVAGRDFVGERVAVSPFAGVAVRHLSNGTTGTPGFRTDNYLSVPVGVTVRTRVGSSRVLGLTVEYDHLLRGWQTTRSSLLGGGTAPATATEPAFTIEGFSDASFDQHGGRAIRASARLQLTRRWLVEPYFIYWRVDPSDPNFETVTFTVNGITVQEQLGFYEPLNTTRELGVRVGFRF